MPEITLAGRKIGPDYAPLVIAEIGINHEGDYAKAERMVRDAHAVGCECVKFQCHVVEDEMSPQAKSVIPGNADVSIYEIMDRCQLSEADERKLMDLVQSLGMIYLSTPFSRAAADRLEGMGVPGYKIGSGECNNYPLVDHIASFGKPVILSTGMNSMESVAKSVDILRKRGVPFGLMHTTSMYPTPPEKVRLGAMVELMEAFPDAVVGLSDHTLTIYPCLGAAALGACMLERHFTSDKAWPGPDVFLSMDPKEMQELIEGSAIIQKARGGTKAVLPEEQVTIDFAYASCVTIGAIKKGEPFTKQNLWVKRPGTGKILAEHFEGLLGRTASQDIDVDTQLDWSMVDGR
ncbi:MAG TPA: N-acetylneuraminate synthase family protein [Humidesulfovibrio sp.]|uniref:N-acetylneuraminate synthase family protein n=1 Tax=Humidesulfovibrio sp. TaxID=2910988 RepID=UPI002D0ED5BD|nr:N-acetylneuraminate synthase family protein [Humidesulfovibrio sp.]HWR02990.1 N-acetylneuraminate synthase family protein [Humidesulfovibrio sp.]